MSDKSKICAIGEKKQANGKWWLAVGEPDCMLICDGFVCIPCDPPQPETPAVEECAGCRYWLERGADTAGDILGSCRRDPPQVYRDDYGDRFPLTWPHDWCGEWKP